MMRWEAGDMGKPLQKAAREILRLRDLTKSQASESGRLRVRLDVGAAHSQATGAFLRDSARS